MIDQGEAITVSEKLDTTAEAHLSQLRQEGWCVIEGVIPEAKVDAVRRSVEAASEQATAAYKDENRNVITYLQAFAPYLADERVLELVTTMFNHPHVRIAQTELKIRPPYTDADPNADEVLARSYHSDWPHDIRDLSESGHIQQPFPDIIMAVITLWMLSPFKPENGGTWIVPRSHRDIRNPRGDDGMDPTQPIRNEMQVTGSAGSVLITDSRIWHTAAANQSDNPRVAVLARYVPWWVSVELGKRNQAIVPVDVFDTFPEDVKPLYQHRVRE